MYKLEDRILFDGAAVADVAEAQQEAQQAAEDAAAQEAAEAAAQENADYEDGGDSETETSDALAEVIAAVNLGSDGQRVDVLLISSSLENADDIANAVASGTIVVRYDARTASAADLIQQITDALDGKLADSIGFVTESGENAQVQLFADSDTSLDTVNDSVHQNFWSGLDVLLDDGAQINLFSSNLASTTEGIALVDAISDALDHDVAASIDETGSENAGGNWNLEYSTNGVETDIADTYLDENLIDNFTSLLEDDVNHEVAFINSSIMNVEALLTQFGDDVEIVRLEAGVDGLEQITNYLNEHSDIKYDVVHIITHGNEGYLNLGSSYVDSEFIEENTANLVQWRNALSDDADIMIYGCNLAGNDAGRDLIALIASATGADIAASNDMVRNNDWSLEYNVGDINYGSLDILNYNYNLVDYLVTTIEDVDFSSLLTLREAIILINDEGSGGGGTISFDSFANLKGDTIRLNADAGYRDLTVTGNVTINGQIHKGNGVYTYVKITRAAGTADTNDLEVDRAFLESYTTALDTDIAAIQAALKTYQDDPTRGNQRLLYYAVRNTMDKDGSTYDGSASNTFDYSALVNDDGDNLVDIAEGAAGTDPLAIANARLARVAQDLIDDPTTGFDTLLAANWTLAKSLFGVTSSYITEAQAQNFINYFTNMSDNSTEISSSESSTDPTDIIIIETNNVAARTDTDPANRYRLITVVEGGNLTLINTTLFGGYSDVNVSGSIAAGRGGAIYISEGSSATLINVDVTRNSKVDTGIITGNQATQEGGGIYNAGSLTVYENESLWAGPHDPSQSIAYCIAGTSGGAIYSTGDLSIEGPGINELVPIYSNVAQDGSGGGIYSEGTISLMDNVYFYGNTATENGGGAYITSINDPLTFDRLVFSSNSATNSGGGLAYLDSPGALTIIRSDFYDNSAGVNGGAIYMENTGDFTFLGTSYLSDEYKFCYENSEISRNQVSSGEGGGFYLSRVGDVLLNSVNFNSNYGRNTGNLNLGGGAIKMANSGDLSIIDSNYRSNSFAHGSGGAIDYDGGTNGDKTLSIATSYFGRNGYYIIPPYYVQITTMYGGAIYQTAGDLNIVNSTFHSNEASTGGGAILVASSVDLSINSATFGNNSAGNNGSAIYVAGSALTGSISLNNTIFSNSFSGVSQIVLPDEFDIKSSTYNIFSHYYDYGSSALRLADGTVTDATNYVDASNNYVGTSSGGSAYIVANLFLSNTAVYTANYKTYTLALTSEDSIAYRSGSSGGLKYDQRGNTRNVDPYGGAMRTSRGAFEPIFNLIVTTTADDTNLLRFDPAGYYSNLSWANGITLREAIYWVDSGDGENTGVVSFNDGSKSGHNFHAENADNKITLNGQQITIGLYRRSYYSDKTMTINGVATSQDAANRVIVDAGGLSRVLITMAGTTKINHLTFQNGKAPAVPSGATVRGMDTWGGGIYNNSRSTLTLNNVVVRDSVATAYNWRGDGYGGGIYNSGTLTLNDTTVTGNQAIAVSDSKHVWIDGGHGGGIYNTSRLYLYRSTVDNNSTIGNQYVTESAKGAGIYNKSVDINRYINNVWTIESSNLQVKIENSTIAYNHNMPSASLTTGGEGSAIYFKPGERKNTSSLSIINSTIAHNYITCNNASADWNLKSAVYIDVQDPFLGIGSPVTLTLTITNSILADNYVNQKDGSIVVGHWNDFYITDTSAYTGFTLNHSTTYNVVGFFNYMVYDFRDEASNHVGAYLPIAGNPERGHVQDLYLNETLDYRGGKTQVLSLLEGSLLLDLATNHGTDVSLTPITNYMTGGSPVISNPDQRGNTRVNGSYSIGSYQPLFAITVDIATDEIGTNHGWNWGGYTTKNPPANAPGWTSNNSIRDALYWIDPTGTITVAFGPEVETNTITLNADLGQLWIDKSMTIFGNGITIQAATSAGTAANRVMYLVNPDHLSITITVKLQNMTIQHGVDSYGGGIYNNSNLTLEGVTVQNNKTNDGHGGGIYSLGGSLTIGTYGGTVYSNIIGNTAQNRGGGIYYESQSTLSITQTDVLDNEALEGSGGGIYITGADFSLTASTIGNNTAEMNGGGINLMATNLTMINSTIANNTTGQLGGGMAFFVGGVLDMNFVTIANNISGTNTKVSSQFGGGLYMSAGTFKMTNSVLAQNYRTSIDAANRDDFYVGATINTGPVSYNVFGVVTDFTIPGTNNTQLGTVANPWTDLSLDTMLTDNGGPTLTLYVFNTDSVLQDNADQTTTVDVDQRGVGRAAPTITIGAYQKNITEWVYIGDADADAADLNNTLNWALVSGSGPMGAVGTPDQTLYFDAGAGTDDVIITESWDVSYKASVVVDNLGQLTVAGISPNAIAILTVGLTVRGGGIFTVGANAEFVAATSTAGAVVIVTLQGSGSKIIVNNKFTGKVNVSEGTLVLSTEDNNIKDLSLGNLSTDSTVEYSYDEKQTIKLAIYGNLTISGADIKTAKGDIVVSGDLDNSSEFTSSYDITVDGDAVSTGNIKAKNIILNGTANDVSGDLIASQDLTIGGVVSTGLLEAKNVIISNDSTVADISATTISGGANLTVTGTVTTNSLIAGVLTLNNNASVTTVNATMTALNSLGGDNTLKFTGTDANNMNFSDWTITVSGGSTLNIDRGSNNIKVADSRTIPVPTDPFFHIENTAVSSTSTLKFITTGDLFVTNVISGNLGNFNGTLWLKSKNITFSENCEFDGGNMSVFIENSGFFDLKAGATLTFRNGIGINNLRIVAGTGNPAILESALGDVTIISNITSTDSTHSLIINAATTVTVAKVSGIADLTINAGTSVTVGGVVKISGDLDITATTTTSINNKVTSGGDVAIHSNLNLIADISAGGSVVVDGTTAVNANSSISADTLTLTGVVSGASNLALGITGTAYFAGGVDMDGDLILNKGFFDTGDDIATGDLNIKSPASLALGVNSLTTGNLTNAGTLNASTVSVRANITNTGDMTIEDLNLIDNSQSSTISLSGTVDAFNSISLADGKDAILTRGNITTTNFTFGTTESTSTFTLGSKTSLDVTNINYNAGATYYDGNYFNTANGGQLVQTMNGTPVLYRVGNSTSATVVTLTVDNITEKIAVSTVNSVKVDGDTVTGIKETSGFTTVIERNFDDTVGVGDIVVSENWDAVNTQGTGFIVGDSELYTLNGGEWSSADVLTYSADTDGTRSWADYSLAHNGVYAIANIGANLTVPGLPMNINIYELANAHFMSMYQVINSNIMLDFPIGLFPYFTSNTWVSLENLQSVGKAAYREMEYRLTTNPLTNPLGGQVPPPGAILGQVITQGANLTLTADAPIYLKVNGEYSVGRGWLPLSTGASVENIEQFQAPLEQGQIDQFYLDFGGRGSVLERPVSFQSELDQMLDELLAG